MKPPRYAAALLVLGSLLVSMCASAQTRLFAVDGATLTLTGDTNNSTARPIPDGGTGVYYTWLDTANATGGGASVYVTHLSSTGALATGWPTGNGGAVQVVSNANDSNGGFDAASDANGGIIILWTGLSGASFGIYGQRINASGTALWTAGGVAMTAGTPSQEFGFGSPYVVGTGGSQVLMFAHGASPVATPGGYFMARKLSDGSAVAGFTGNSGFGVLITTFSTVATGGSTSPQTAFGVNASTLTLSGNTNNGQPVIVADTTGGSFVVYDDPTNGVGSSSSVFVTHYSSAGAVAWTTSISSAVSDSGGGIQASSDGNGGVVVFYNDAGGVGYAQRLNSAGAKQWALGGVKFYTAGFGYTAPVALNSSIIAYGAADTPATTIYGRGLNTADGSAAFSVAITTVSQSFDSAYIASPAGGTQAHPGMIVVLSNNLTGAHNDIYAYRFDSVGAKNWTAVLSAAAADKGIKGNNGGALAADADGSGGVYAAWVSSQSGAGASLYGARLTVDGAQVAGWTAVNGVLLANTSQAGSLSLAAAGGSGFLTAWTNNTGNNTQSPVFVQQVTAAGVTQLGASGRQVGTGRSFSAQVAGEGGSAAVLVGGTAAPQFMVSWSSNTGSGASPVMTQAFDASGNQLFAGPGIPAQRDVPGRTVQYLQTLGTGNVIMLAWQEVGATAFDFTQAISTYLAPTGTQNVQPALVVAPSPTAVNPGYIVGYAENLSTSPYASIVAAKCDVTGTIDWSALVTNSQYISVLDPTFSKDLTMASDGSGGAYFLWASSKATPGGEIYASYLTSLGALGAGWTANGTRIAYANYAAHLTIAGSTSSMVAAWTNGINGDGASNNPVYDQIASAGASLKFSAGSSPASPGGSLLGTGQTQTNSAAVTNPTAGNADLFVAWQVNTGGLSNPLKVQAYDASGTALFGSGYQAVQHAGTRVQNNAYAVAASSNLALGWSENNGSTLFSQFITTSIIGPVAPSSPTITSISSSSFVVSWGTAPALATGYELDVSSDPAFVSGVTVLNYGSTISSASVTGLLLNTSWYAQVGSLSATQPARYASATPFPAVTLAPSVTSFLLVSASSASIKANWQPYTFGQAVGYELDASTAANFTGTLLSTVSYGLNPSTLTLSGVIPNTTYYLRVGELNSAGTANFVSEGSTATAAALPTVAGTVTSSNTATFSWGSADAAGTQYRVDLSTDGVTLNYSVFVATTNATFTGLASNTTYYGQVTAIALSGANAGPVNLTTGITQAAAPSALGVTVFTTSATLNWSANGNSTSTLYTAQFSTNSFASILGSASSTTTSASQNGLLSNATFYARVYATNAAGFNSTFTVLAATATDPASPLTANPGAVTATSITAFWGGGTNAPGTAFLSQISTDSFASVNSGQQSTGTSASFNGLSANTAYNFRVTAIGQAGTRSPATVLPSTSTALLPPAVATTTFLSVGSSSAAVQWANGGNGPGTSYTVQVSTDNLFGSIYDSSTTVSTSAILGAGTALNPNTTYYFRVESSTTANNSVFVALGSTITPPAQPTAATQVFTSVGAGVMTVNWSSGSALAGFNGPSTVYKVQLSTSAGFVPVVSATTTALANTFSGLIGNTVYFSRVAAFGSATGSFGAFVSLGSTATLTAPPGAASFSGVNTTSVTANWTANGDPGGTQYQVQLSTDPVFGGVIFSSVTVNLSAPITGLTPNTTYYGQAAAFSVNTGTYTAYTSLGAVPTLAAVPTGPAISTGATFNTATWSWGANGNPAGTLYSVQIASVPSFAPLWLSTSTTGLTAPFTGLIGNSTYYMRVAAVNSTGTASAFAVALPSATVPGAPIQGAYAFASSNTIHTEYGANGSIGSTCIIRLSTDNFLTTVASSQAVVTAASYIDNVFFGLTPNTGYGIQVEAVGYGGTNVYSVLVGTSTLPIPPGAAPTPIVSASSVSVSVAWTSGGNPAGTVYVAQVSTDNFLTTNASSPTLSLGAVISVVGPISANATFYFRVETATLGVTSAFLSLGSTNTPTNIPGVSIPAFNTVGLTNLNALWLQNGNSAGTEFLAQFSTSASFSTIFTTGITQSQAWFPTGLVPNTTYYARAAPYSLATQSYEPFLVIGSTATLAPQPAAAAYGGASTGSLFSNWTANGNPAGTVYQLQFGSDPTFASVSAVVFTPNLTAAVSGLSPNATYYGQVAAYSVNTSTYTPFTSLGAGYSLAAVPASPAVTAVSTSTTQVSWTVNGNPAGTLYTVQIATSAGFGNILQSSSTVGVTAGFATLAANTTYFTRVEALNSTGAASAFAISAASSTQASPPLSAAPTAVTTNTITANWTAGDAAGTIYLAQISTNGFATVNASSQTRNSAATFSGLASNTAYSFQVAALGNDGTLTSFTTLPTTSTLLLPPAALVSSATFVSVSTYNAQVAWGSGGNGAGTTYVAQVSTDNFASSNASSSTFNLGALFGQGGQGATLAPNTTYYFRVQTSTTANASAFVSLGSTISPVNAPLAAAFSGVGLTGLTANWSANTDPAGTRYQVQIATTAAFAPVTASSQTTATAVAFTGLTSNATYYARVAAFSSALGAYGAYTALGSTATTAPVPSASAFTAVSTGAATGNWTANGNPAGTVYAVVLAADAAFADAVLPTVYTANLNTVLTGLTPNTSYYGEVAAFSVNTATYTAFTNLGALWTLANPPVAPAVAAVSTGSVTMGWTANGDPAGTQYVAQLSTSAVFGGTVLVSSTVATSAAFGGLAANTTYYTRVEAFNSSGTASAFAVAAASSTQASAPVSAAPTAVTTNSVTANWTTADAAGTVYTAQISTDGFVSVNSSALTASLTATFPGLLSNTSYGFRVAARGNDGTLTSYTALPSTSTLLLPPAAAGTTYIAVSTISAQIAWASGGNGAGTTYVAQVSTDNFATTNASSSTLNLGALFGQGGQGATLAPNTTYFFRVQTSTTANASAFVSLGSTITPVNAPLAAAFSGVGAAGLTANWTANGDPSGTQYQVQIATTAGFVAIAAAQTTTGTAFGFTSLSANTTYYGRVASFSSALGGYGAYTALGSTATTASAPLASAFTAVSSGAATANWTANGNPAGTVYALVLAADAAFADAVQPTVYTANLNTVLTGLTANTSYYGEVAAYSVNTATYTAFTNLGALWTLANTPAAPAVSAASTGSISVGWTANGNPGGTQYVAQLSTNAGFGGTVLVSSTVATSTAFGGLAANTTYFTRVEAFNSSGTATAFALAAASSTVAAAPVSAAPTFLSTGSVVANWTANGNSATTVFVAQLSADGFTTVAATVTAPATSAAFTGLSANTAYAFRVAAKGNDGTQTPFVALPSTSTLLLPPATTTTIFVNVTTAAAQIAWGNGGNGAGTTYVAQISTDNFADLLASSSTLNTGATFGGLGPNTTYFFQVKTTTTGNSSAFVPLGSTVTPSFAPTGTAVLSVTSTTVVTSWSANGNPAGTTYELWRDLTGAFSAPVKTIVSTTNYQTNALAPNTTYFYQVRTLGFGGAYTGFDSAVSTATLPPAPGVPGTPAGFALGTTSVSWNWSAATFANSYKVYRAASLVQLASTSTLAYFDAGLATNTAYGLVVGGINATGAGPLSPSATLYTLAAPPTGTAAGIVAATSATLSWSLNTNPGGTFSEVQRSSDGVVYASVVSSVSTAGYTDASLIGCTSYYYKVRNINGGGLPTGFDAPVQIFTANTIPAAASGLTATASGGNRIALSWTGSPTEGITAYDVYYDSGTGVVSYASALATVPSTMTAFTSPVLTSSGSYVFAVRAKHRCGVEENNGVFATATATATVAALRAAVQTPTSGHHIDGNNLSVVAGLTSGSPSQVAQIRFQYRVSGSTNAWIDMVAADVNHPNPALTAPYFIHWNASALTAGGYDLRSVASDISGSTDTAADIISVAIDHATPDTTENLSGGQVTRTQTFNTAITNSFFTGGDNTGDPLIKIVIPPAAVSGTTVSASVLPVAPLSLSTNPPSGFAISGNLVMRITLNNGQSSFLGGNTAQITFGYTGTLGTAPQIWSLNENTGVWANDCANSVVDTVNHTITCSSTHFTVFAVLTGGAAAADLSGVRAYPVPYKPNGSDRNQGGGNTGIFFDRMPSSASIKIYTAQGRLVTSFDASSPNGKVVWDARNDDGRDVATGLYVAIISSPGQKPVTKKLLIVR